MNSQDVFTITADEQSFRVYVVTTLDAHNTRLTRLEEQQASMRGDIQEIRGELKEVRAGIKVVNDNQLTLAAKLDAMSYWGGIFIAGMAVLAAVIGIFMPLYMLKASRKEDTPAPAPVPAPAHLSVQDMSDIIDMKLSTLGFKPKP